MRVLRLADVGVLVELADLDQVLALYAALCSEPPPGVVDLVPAARTLLLRVDPNREGVAEVERAVRGARPRPNAAARADVVRIPVHYHGDDLAEVAELTGLTVAEVIAAHTGTPWTVAFCGFAPGFGYLAGGDPRLRVPRRAQPRVRVSAGAVGLAGEFSGVYPRTSPGGWQLIGHTDLALWNPDEEPPALLRPGMRVEFAAAS